MKTSPRYQVITIDFTGHTPETYIHDSKLSAKRSAKQIMKATGFRCYVKPIKP